MRPLNPQFFAASLSAVLAGWAAAQGPEQSRLLEPGTAAGKALRAGHATIDVDGRIEAYGRAFKARFEPGRVEYLPALGATAQRDHPLSFALERVTRGGSLVHEAEPVRPSRAGDLVVYARGAELEERYSVSAEGVHQTFLFASLPAGSGDLVVRGIVVTDLAPRPTPGGGLFFGDPELGGVRVGAVFGIDAEGRTAAGSLGVAGGALELVLPAAFVDTATFPVLLDPLLGTQTTLDDTSAIDSSPEIAKGDQGYLVVWERSFSLTHQEVYGQRVDGFGNLEGGLVPISTGNGTLSREPAAGGVASESNYLVAFTYAPNVLTTPQVRCVNVSFFEWGDVSSSVAVAPSANIQSSPDVGGDLTETDDEAFVVWDEAGAGVRGRTVTATEDAAPVPVGAAFTIAATTATVDPINPRISRYVLTDVDFLVVWQRWVNDGASSFVAGRMYDRNGNARSSETALHSNGFVKHANPDCDGDDDAFLAAWQQSESLAATEYDIVCRAITWDGSSLLLSSPVRAVEEGDMDNETSPSVALTNSNAIVGYLDRDGADTNAYLKNVDPFTAFATGEVALTSGATSTEVSLAGWSSSDIVLAVWDDGDVDDILGQRYSGVGTNVGEGGGCGVQGQAVIPGALAGNANFAIHLRGATPNVLGACVIGQSEFPIACGTCTLVPNLETVLYDQTDGLGNAIVTLPLSPAYGGLTFWSQWVTFVAVGTCPLAPIDLTGAFRTTIDSDP